MNGGVDGLKSLFNVSLEDILQLVLRSIDQAYKANLRNGVFVAVYSSSIGLVILLAIVGAVWHLISVAVVNNKQDTAINGFLGSLKLAGSCILLPGAITAVMFVTQKLSLGVLDALGDKAVWTAGLNQPFQEADIFFYIFLIFVSKVVSIILDAEISISQFGIYFVVLLMIFSLIAWSVRGKLGDFSRICLALLITCVFVQPVLYATLGISGKIIASIDAPVSVKTWMVLWVYFFCIFLFFILFWFTNKRVKSFIENRVNVDGMVKVNGKVTAAIEKPLSAASIASMKLEGISGSRVSQQPTVHKTFSKEIREAVGDKIGGKNVSVTAISAAAIAKRLPPQVQVPLKVYTYLKHGQKSQE